MRQRFIILGSLTLSLTFLNSCEKDKDETGSTTSTTSTTATTTSSTTTGTTTTGTTTGLACSPTSSEVVIGTQTWTTANLNVDKFRNGDVILEAKTEAEWEAAGNAGTAAWCYYLNSVDSGAKYGKLYNWYAVNDSRGLAPAGWHVPSDSEWTVLATYLGGNDVAGKKMKSTCGWLYDGSGSDSSSFTGFSGGYRESTYNTFSKVGLKAFWWSTSEYSTYNAQYCSLNGYDDYLSKPQISKAMGMSVRCLKD